ncbi:MAG: hypothetical protein AAF999_00640 [Pseudomonadota bacterium]
MIKRAVTLELPAELMQAVQDLASEQEDTIAQVVEGLVSDHLVSKKGMKRRPPPASERLVFALQNLLFRDLAEAISWEDLDARLRRHGYFLKISWGGLSLHTETSGQKLCHTHDIGFSYGTFLRRFGPGKPKDPREV